MSGISDILSQYNNLQSSGMMDSLEKLKKENKELERLIDDISELISHLTIDSMLDYLIKKFLDYFIPEKLVFVIKVPHKKELRQYYYKQLILQDREISDDDYYKLKGYIDSEIAEHNAVRCIDFDDLKVLFKTEDFGKAFNHLHPKIVVPLVGIGGTFGIVIMSNKITGQGYSQPELFYMQRMFSVLAVTIQNGLHYESSITDVKTGLYTYDYFLHRTRETIANVQRYKKTAAMLIIDIDFFKKFNDTWGHLTGDKVLIALAKCLKSILRKEDCIARFGGEEFSILLPQCKEDAVFETAEMIRKAIEKIELVEKGAKLSITASIGGCLIEDIEGIYPKYIFEKADAALYNSKKTGRNKCTIYKLGLLDRAKLKRIADETEQNELQR